MLLYSDEYQIVEYKNNNQTLVVDWTDATSKLREKNYKDRLLYLGYFIKRNSPQSMLANIRNLIYTATYGSQKWLLDNISNTMNTQDVKKLAFIKSRDTITQLLVENMINQVSNKEFSTAFFENESDAFDWLAKK